jgi:hypothetical protein
LKMNVAGVRALGLLDQVLQHLRCREVCHRPSVASEIGKSKLGREGRGGEGEREPLIRKKRAKDRAGRHGGRATPAADKRRGYKRQHLKPGKYR